MLRSDWQHFQEMRTSIESTTMQLCPSRPHVSSHGRYFQRSTTVSPVVCSPMSSMSTRCLVLLNNSGWATYATVSASCNGGPSLNPKVDLYEFAKYEIRVESVWRKFVEALGRSASSVRFRELPGESSSLWMALVTIAVCVTLIGIIVVLTGALRTICAACAAHSIGQKYGGGACGEELTIT